MSAGIKRMLAERAKRQNYTDPGITATFAQIKSAAERLDQGFASKTGWKPSELLTIGYCALLTGPRPSLAEEFVAESLRTQSVRND